MLAHPTIDLRAGYRAGEIAAAYGARLIVATVYIPAGDTRGSWAVPPGIRPNPDPKREGYMLSSNAPIYAILREARDRAKPAPKTSKSGRSSATPSTRWWTWPRRMAI